MMKRTVATGLAVVTIMATPVAVSAEAGGYAEPDESNTTEDASLPVLIDVLSNDADGAVITGYSTAGFGTVSALVTDGVTTLLAYQPNPDANGVDTFTYDIEIDVDGVLTAETETVTINVAAGPDDPVVDPPEPDVPDAETPVDDNPYAGFGGLDGEVVRIYSAMLGRRPDLGGFQYWVDQREAGLSFEGMVNQFADSPEFKSIYGDMIRTATDEEWVEFVYGELMNRESEESGRAFWYDALDSGRFSRSAMVIFFAQSPEYRVLTGTE